MSRQFEDLRDESLAALVRDASDWDDTGILPNGALRIEADRYCETVPIDAVTARKYCRDAAFKEASLRWMKSQKF